MRAPIGRAAPDFDPYGKDLSKISNGKDTVFRMTLNEKGLVSKLTPLSDEEAEASRPARKRKPAKRLRKGMGR